MNRLIIQACLILCVAALVFAGQAATLEEAIAKNTSVSHLIKDARDNGCVCVSSSFGCENIKMKGRMRMLQTGYCRLRCCTDNAAGERKKCACFNASDCPDDFPIENGDCVNMSECCPDKKPRRSEL